MPKKSKQEFYVVEADIPIPDGRSSSGDSDFGKKYPFAEMNIGDSFLAPLNKRLQALIWAGKSFSKRRQLDRKFIVKAVKDGWRIWRIK